VIQEEERQIGKIRKETYNEYFSYSYGLAKSVLILVSTHILINLSAMGVSVYLALILKEKIDHDDDVSRNNFIFVAIVVAAILASFLGKYLSVKIVREDKSEDCSSSKYAIASTLTQLKV